MKETIVRESLTEYIKTFDNENRGNRLSKEVITGTAQFLEVIILNIIDKVEESKKEDTLQEK